MSDLIHITMLGRFSIQCGNNTIDDSSNRMKKVWLLLAYLIYTRNTRTTQNGFLALIRGAGNEEIDDPAGRLKALFYRARTMLNQLEDSLGHTLILYKNGNYTWNNQISIQLDVEEFDRLYTEAATQTGDMQLDTYLQALSLYQGEFLPKLSMEPWVMPISAYYHQRFLEAAERALAMLEIRERWDDVAALSSRCLTLEPYSEALYQHLMRSRLALGDRAGVLAAYEEMSELLFETFGVMPSDESRQIYRDASRETNDQAVPIGTVREQLRESSNGKGAVFCEYDFFRLLYQVQARAIVRSGDVVHIALLSLHGQNRKPLARRSLDIAMDNLQELVLGNLRQGDVVTRCSVSQLILMLPQANYENSCAVCQRVIKAFYRQYPHSPADIHFSVQPLEPMVPDLPPRSEEK